jgi:hypothetical protein
LFFPVGSIAELVSITDERVSERIGRISSGFYAWQFDPVTNA